MSGVFFYGVIRGWEVVPTNGDKPLGSEVGFPVVLDHCLHHLPEGLGFGVDSLEFSVEGGSGGVMGFRSWFGLIPSFHSGMFLTAFVTVFCMLHKYCCGNGFGVFETL